MRNTFKTDAEATLAAQTFVEQQHIAGAPVVDPNLIIELLRRPCCMDIANVRAKMDSSTDLQMKEAYAFLTGEMHATAMFKKSIRKKNHPSMDAARLRMLPANAALGKHHYLKLTCRELYAQHIQTPTACAFSKEIFSIQGKALDEIAEQNIQVLKTRCPKSDSNSSWNSAMKTANNHHRSHRGNLLLQGITLAQARPSHK